MGERSAMPNDRDTRQGRRIYQFFYVKMDAHQDYELRLHRISPRIMNAVLGGIAVTGGWLLWSFDIPSAPWFGAFFMVAGVLAACFGWTWRERGFDYRSIQEIHRFPIARLGRPVLVVLADDRAFEIGLGLTQETTAWLEKALLRAAGQPTGMAKSPAEKI